MSLPLNELKVHLHESTGKLVGVTKQLLDHVDGYQLQVANSPSTIRINDSRLRKMLFDYNSRIVDVTVEMAGVIKQLGKFKLPSDVSDLPLKGFANGLSEPVGLPNTPQNNLDQNSYTTAADMVTTEQMGNGSAACAIVNPPTLTQPNGLERPLPYLNWSHRYPPVQSSDNASTIIPVANLIDIDGPPIDAATVLPQAQKQLNGNVMSSHGEEIFSTSAQPAMIERENPLMGETFDAALCWVENPSLFWVTKIPPQHSIIWTENEVTSKLKCTIVSNPTIGHYCISPYYDHSTGVLQYYRGRITGLEEREDGNYAKILYIDFGNSEMVSVELLKELPNRFYDIKWQCVPCKLANVEPRDGVEWDSQDAGNLVSLLQEENGVPRNLRVKVLSPADNDRVYPVDLSIVVSETPGSMETQLDNVNRSFIGKGFGRASATISGTYQFNEVRKSLEDWQKPMSSRRQATATSAQVTPQMISSTPPVCPPIGPVGIGERVTQRSERLTGPADPRYDLRTDSLFGFKIPACQFSIPSSGEVRFKVAAAIQPDEFYVHLADGIITSSSADYMGLAEELDRHFAQPQNLVKFQTVAELNQLPVCMAQRNDMYGFHRGMVESLKRSTTRRRGLEEETYEVIVFFVDLGVRETKLWQEIYQLPSRFSRLPQRSLRCRLWGVKPVAGGNWTSAAIELFKRLCRCDVELNATVVAEAEPLPICIEVALGQDYKGKRVINQILVTERLAEAADDTVWE